MTGFQFPRSQTRQSGDEALGGFPAANLPPAAWRFRDGRSDPGRVFGCRKETGVDRGRAYCRRYSGVGQGSRQHAHCGVFEKRAVATGTEVASGAAAMLLLIEGAMARQRAVGEIAVQDEVVGVLRSLDDPRHDRQGEEDNE